MGGQGVLLEALMTMVLVLLVYTSAVDKNNALAPGLAPLVIGLWVAAACLMGVPYTGTSINPARSLGPPLVMGNWDSDQWVFWVGPMIGGVVGGLLYTWVLRQDRKQISVEETSLPVSEHLGETENDGVKPPV